MSGNQLCGEIPSHTKIKLLRLWNPQLPLGLPDMDLLRVLNYRLKVTQSKSSETLDRLPKDLILPDEDEYRPFFLLKFPLRKKLLTHGPTIELVQAFGDIKEFYKRKETTAELTPELKLGLLSALYPCMFCESRKECSLSAVHFFPPQNPLKPYYISIGNNDI